MARFGGAGLGGAWYGEARFDKAFRKVHLKTFLYYTVRTGEMGNGTDRSGKAWFGKAFRRVRRKARFHFKAR